MRHISLNSFLKNISKSEPYYEARHQTCSMLDICLFLERPSADFPACKIQMNEIDDGLEQSSKKICFSIEISKDSCNR